MVATPVHQNDLKFAYATSNAEIPDLTEGPRVREARVSPELKFSRCSGREIAAFRQTPITGFTKWTNSSRKFAGRCGCLVTRIPSILSSGTVPRKLRRLSG